MSWTVADVTLTVVDADTDHPVMTMTLDTPAGRLWLMAEPQWIGSRIMLRRTHVYGDGVGPNEFGAARLHRLALLVMEILDAGELIVEGAVRTTGAGPGHRPRPIRFTRTLRPAGQ